MASADWACGYLGPWNLSVAPGEALALNRKNSSDDPAGHFRVFRIERARLQTLHDALRRQQLLAATATVP